MNSADKTKFSFRTVVICRNPMETEIFPAVLREHEIPHRTERAASGELEIMVPEEWVPEAVQTLQQATRIFFGDEFQKTAAVPPQEATSFAGCNSPTEPDHNPPGIEEKGKPDKNQEGEGEGEGDDEEDEMEQPPLHFTTSQGKTQSKFSIPSISDPTPSWLIRLWSSSFSLQGLDGPADNSIRAIWPAWVLASIPGLGLGHLYAGNFKTSFYLMLASMVGILFFRFTDSYLPLGIIVLTWSIDLVKAPRLVRQQNLLAAEKKKQMAETEKEFLESLNKTQEKQNDQKI